MSAPANIGPSGCCSPVCTDTVTQQVPGPPGQDGHDGTDGTDGINAFTVTSLNFSVPAIALSVTVTVADSVWAANGQIVFVSTAGYYQVTGIPLSTQLTLKNLGYPGNAAPATVITAPQQVSPGGLEGPAGSAPSVTLNDLSVTTSKGDLIVDNGALSPAASDVRLGVGSNGKALVADSTQPTGLNYKTITPNTVTNDNNIPRFDGTSGNPMPLQDSKLLITDDGAIQSTPSGGNARGSKAVDLQVDRAANTQVASGADSVVAGGKNNTGSGSNSTVSGGSGNLASGTNATVSGGTANTASDTSATVSGGTTNTASKDLATIGGGSLNTASGSGAAVLGGQANTASGGNASVLGGSFNIASATDATTVGGTANQATATYSVASGNTALANKHAQKSHSAGAFFTGGDSQATELIWRNLTTDATPTELFLDGAALRAVVPLNTTWGGIMTIVGRSSAGVGAVWEVKFGIQNNANTVSLISAVSVAMIADGTGGSWGVTGNAAVTADNINKTLKVAMTGFAATNIRWTAHARFVEVNY